jgi:prolyl oligopeptidase
MQVHRLRVLPSGAILALFLVWFLLLGSSCVDEMNTQEETVLKSPPNTRSENVVNEIYGHKVSDPYRWLEQMESEEVKTWVDEQNDYTRTALDNLTVRPKIKKRLEELLSIGYIGGTQLHKGKYFFTKREGKQNQAVLYIREGTTGGEKVLVDPNVLDKQGLVTLDWWYPSDDGKLLAYGLSKEGTEMSTLYIMNTETGEKLPDVITRTRYTGLSWKGDNSGFYYTRLPEPGSVPEGEENYHRHVYYHQLGRDPDKDPKVFGEGRDMTEWQHISFSNDDRNLLLSTSIGWATSDLYFQPLKSAPGAIKADDFIPIAVGLDALFSGTAVGENLYLHTNYQAPRYRMLKVDLKNPDKENWEGLIPEEEAILQQVEVVGDWLVAQYMEKASSRLKIFSLSGKYLKDIELPALGSVYGLGGEWDGSEIVFVYNSYFIPPTMYRYDLLTDQLSILDQVETDIDTTAYQVKQVWYESKDGTKVSMFLVHKKGLKLNGENPTLLTGYGGFNSAQTPVFQRNTFLWLERGGVFAEANLRGGSEYGEEWHKAGMLGNKQNTFDDFIAAGEWLVSNGYTKPSKLAIFGGSNGGLLVGAAMTQRPDLFKVVICWNPLLDMVRYHNFLIAKLWVPEYGSPEDSVQFQWLYAYSPYHRVVDGTHYPATLFLTADSDSRVDPMHAVKMTARVQAANSSDAPIMLRFDTKAGHAGAPLSKTIQEYSDIWSFVFWQLGVEY